uniref:Uncharacterized protein n=1 Tax=Tetranychus urticae TaxID=32264 RepID=T1L571_TETUR
MKVNKQFPLLMLNKVTRYINYMLLESPIRKPIIFHRTS